MELVVKHSATSPLPDKPTRNIKDTIPNIGKLKTISKFEFEPLAKAGREGFSHIKRDGITTPYQFCLGAIRNKLWRDHKERAART